MSLKSIREKIEEMLSLEETIGILNLKKESLVEKISSEMKSLDIPSIETEKAKATLSKDVDVEVNDEEAMIKWLIGNGFKELVKKEVKFSATAGDNYYADIEKIHSDSVPGIVTESVNKNSLRAWIRSLPEAERKIDGVSIEDKTVIKFKKKK